MPFGIVLLCIVQSFCQVTVTINAGGTAYVGQSTSYSASVTGGSPGSYYWSVSGGTITSSNTSSSVTVNWSSGTGSLSVQVFSSGGGTPYPIGSAYLSVSPATPPPPAVQIIPSTTSVCTGQTISFSAKNLKTSSSVSYTWKMQGAVMSTGTTMSVSATTDTTIPNAYSPGDVIELFEVTWTGGSTTSQTLVASYSSGISIAPQPSNPISGDQSQCGAGSITLTASTGTNANAIHWYNSSNALIKEEIGASSQYATGLLQIPGASYRVSSYNTNNGCESNRITVSATINPIPEVPLAVNGTHCGVGRVALSATIGANANRVIWNGPTPTNADGTKALSPYINSSASYQIASYNSATGCESTWVPITATVGLVPGIPSGIDGSRFGNGTVLLSATPGTDANTISWYDSYSSTTPLAIALTYLTPELHETKEYWVASRNTTSGCESAVRYSISAIVSSSLNSIITYNVISGNVLDAGTIPTLPIEDVNKTTVYFDGLGRNIQTVAKQASPGHQDIVVPVTYDAAGREDKKYAPFAAEQNGLFKSTNEILEPVTHTYRGAAQSFYSSTDGLVAADNDPYAKIIYEASPLNRVVKQGAPGTNWQPNATTNDYTDHVVKKQYQLNAENEVLFFTYSAATRSLSSSSSLSFYGPEELIKHVTFDESNNQVIEYTDKESHLVCKKVQYDVNENGPLFAETYYVYDDLGSLVLVLPPEAIVSIKAAFKN